MPRQDLNVGGYPLGDLNFDGALDLEDWLAFLAGHGGDFAGLPPDDAYAMGDLDGDLDNDLDDFVMFYNAYDTINGAGSMAGLLTAPEPSSRCWRHLDSVAYSLRPLCGFGQIKHALSANKRRTIMRTFLTLSLAAIALLCIDCCASAALTGYWSFDSGFTNEQGNSALDGTAIGAGTSITNTAGEFQVGGGGLRIDNAPEATDYVDVAGNVIVGQPGSVVNTVVAWYRFDDISLDGADERNFVWETAPDS